ncbi:hypothetical protein [Amycolatopsis thermophila]|uniref:DUF222 domain-containing protein n=1 Tax=Amycolatopsis thermophila TaxID=206084 RepID=A0ABU0ERL6_9PSEU|nr:hypothetical protein [Amycolatopsis thermophila]MDQ0377922.1 hypothetical protein [Amycolatopsis thermophila]
MNRNDTIDLLTAIAARDQRTVGEGDIAAWATDLDDVTLAEALDAVTAFNRSEMATRRRIVAADIVTWVRQRRHDQVERDHAASLKADAQAAYREITAGGLDPHGGRRNSPALEELHAEAMTVACPAKPLGCGQPAGERCVRKLATGEVVATKIPHTARWKQATSGAATLS